MRRHWIGMAAAVTMVVQVEMAAGQMPAAPQNAPVAATRLSDEAFLEDLQRRAVLFFLEQADPKTGMVADRAPADGGESKAPASMAATGFGLAALCIADQRGWVGHEEAKGRALAALRWLAEKQEHVHGFFYHFVDKSSGARVWNCELSSIDTALLLGGVLTAKGHFADADIGALADAIYQRVDWPWMLNGGDTPSMGWTPEKGFVEARWNGFSEHPILYMLAIGSPTHPIPPRCWEAWSRDSVQRYAGYTYLQCPPLFTHQFSQAFVDFRNQRDAFADHWSNSVYATLAHRQFCIDLAREHPGYGPDVWGITASDSAHGYVAWGGPPASGPIDGTVVPCAAAGSLPFASKECMAALRAMQERYGPRIWKRYGFVDAFHPTNGWTDRDVIGIDVGITLLMAENARSGNVWKWFMASPEIGRAMRAAGFRQMTVGFSEEDRRYLRTLAADTWRSIDAMVEPVIGPADDGQVGLYLTDLAVAQKMGLISREEALRRVERTLAGMENSQAAASGSKILAAGLITAAQAFPEVAERYRKQAWALDYGALVEMHKSPALGSDARLAVFLGVAAGKVPMSAWEGLDRRQERRYQVDYLKPGVCLAGLWLDERDTLAGRSEQNFAYAQMRYAEEIGAGAWGWEASLDEVVRPHASVLAIGDFGPEVLRNLRVLERLGARPGNLGFVESVNWKTKQLSPGYRLRDQSVVLISLANVLEDGVVRRWFAADPTVQQGYRAITDYRDRPFARASTYRLDR